MPTYISRRAALRLFAAALGGAWLEVGPRSAFPTIVPAQPGAAEVNAQTRTATATELVIDSESAHLRVRFDPAADRFGLVSLVGHGTTWAQYDDAPGDALWIDRVQVDGGPPVTVDGSGGLELIKSTNRSVTLLHRETGLAVLLDYLTEPGNAIIHRVTLANTRTEGVLQVGSAATVALRLMAGDYTEALGADDSSEGAGGPVGGENGPPLSGWVSIRRDLPTEYGLHELRNADRYVYPFIRLVTSQGAGIIVAVSTTSAWRVSIGMEADRRILRAGEYQSDLTLQPGEQARLPDVVTIYYRDGHYGAVASLRSYLESVSAAPPEGWQNTPPVVFNTWFGYGCAIGDTGSSDSELRYAARLAAQAGVEVLVLDAGWYLGNPITSVSSGRRFRDVNFAGPTSDDGQESQPGQPTMFDFDKGLGTWVENPSKWQARPGDGGSTAAGLRNFSDYIHGLDVRRSDGNFGGKMRLGIWIEPERFDPDLNIGERVPSSWGMQGAPILDFTRSEVVEGIAARIQKVITDYRVDYLKIDANLSVGDAPAVGRTGHYWTRWSAGFEQFLSSLRQANPSLYIEHCASGLKRYWIGLPRLAHSNWLDDQVEFENVGMLLDAADALMLPRQKTVLVTEELSSNSDDADAGSLIRAYWGGDRRNGGTIGFSDRAEQWGQIERNDIRDALALWKRQIRGSG